MWIQASTPLTRQSLGKKSRESRTPREGPSKPERDQSKVAPRIKRPYKPANHSWICKGVNFCFFMLKRRQKICLVVLFGLIASWFTLLNPSIPGSLCNLGIWSVTDNRYSLKETARRSTGNAVFTEVIISDYRGTVGESIRFCLLRGESKVYIGRILID